MSYASGLLIDPNQGGVLQLWLTGLVFSERQRVSGLGNFK
jgi:hypothetical protein